MRFDQQPADRAVAKLRLFGPHRLRVEHQRRHVAAREHVGGLLQRAQLGLVGRDIDRAGAAIRNRRAAVGGHALDEPIVEREAADGEVEQRAALARLDIGRQHAGRCLRRAHPDRPLVDDLDGGAAARQLVRHRAPDDAGADDDDVGGATHRISAYNEREGVEVTEGTVSHGETEKRSKNGEDPDGWWFVRSGPQRGPFVSVPLLLRVDPVASVHSVDRQRIRSFSQFEESNPRSLRRPSFSP